MRCWSSTLPCSSSAAAVEEALWGSTPIITGMRAPFSRADKDTGEGRPTLGLGRPLWSHSRSGAGRTAQPFLSHPEGGSGGCRATCRHPGTLRLQTQGSYPHSISRRRVVEVLTHAFPQRGCHLNGHARCATHLPVVVAAA